MNDRHREVDAQYSMRVVTRLTGLSADTIRAWERRYDAVVPARTDGNTRKYSAEDVRRLTLLKEATRRGYRIGDVARLSEAELQSLSETEGDLTAAAVQPPSLVPRPEDAYTLVRRDYLDLIALFDTRASSGLLSRTSTIFTPRDFVENVVLPILRETGDRWQQGEYTVAHEHLVTQQVRSLLDIILRFSSPHRGAPKLIATTLEGQMHEFGALCGAMLAALRGFDVVYLGPEVPAPDIVSAAQDSNADVVLLSVVYKGSSSEVSALAKALDLVAQSTETWTGIDEAHPVVDRLQHGRLLHRFEDLDIALTKLLT